MLISSQALTDCLERTWPGRPFLRGSEATASELMHSRFLTKISAQLVASLWVRLAQGNCTPLDVLIAAQSQKGSRGELLLTLRTIAKLVQRVCTPHAETPATGLQVS